MKFIPFSISLNNGPNIIKYCVITSAACFVLIVVNTFLISQKSTKNIDSFKMDIKELTRNLESLKNEIKNISIDLIPSKKQSQRWNKCFRNTSLWFNKKWKNLAELDKATK